MEILIITGSPYSGKGTQCTILAKECGYKHISTGDSIRLEKELQTPIGLIMRVYEEQGNLVPDSIMKDLIEKIISDNENETGIILDGYPRTIPQVDALVEILDRKKQPVKLVINIDVPAEELLKRAKKRAQDSLRKDDQDIAIHLKRIEIFETATRPAIEYMKNFFSVVTIDGLGSIPATTEKIKTTIAEV
jgi:adenylate kinase